MVEIEKLRNGGGGGGGEKEGERGGERGGRGGEKEGERGKREKRKKEREGETVKRKSWPSHHGRNSLTFSSLEHMIFISESVSVVPVSLATSIMAAFSLRPT